MLPHLSPMITSSRHYLEFSLVCGIIINEIQTINRLQTRDLSTACNDPECSAQIPRTKSSAHVSLGSYQNRAFKNVLLISIKVS
jgi:hypothetical protein